LKITGSSGVNKWANSMPQVCSDLITVDLRPRTRRISQWRNQIFCCYFGEL